MRNEQNHKPSMMGGQLIYAFFVVFGLIGLVFPLIGLMTIYLSESLSLSGLVYLITGTFALNAVIRMIGVIVAKTRMQWSDFKYGANKDVETDLTSPYPFTWQSAVKFILVSLLIGLIAGGISFINGQTITFPFLGFIVWLLLLWWMPKWFKTHILGLMFLEAQNNPKPPENDSENTPSIEENPEYRYFFIPKRAGTLKAPEALFDNDGNKVITFERFKHGSVTVEFEHKDYGKGRYYLHGAPQVGHDCQIFNEANETFATIGPSSAPNCAINVKTHNFKEHVPKRKIRLFQEHREATLNGEPLYTVTPTKTSNNKKALAIDVHQEDNWDLAIALVVGIIHRGML